MIEKRTQGRPKQGGAQVGRERILVGFVDMVRGGNCDDISRKEIARSVGVTPALITYYFPKGHLLAAEAMIPVFDTYLEGLKSILSDPERPRSIKLKEAMTFIVNFYSRERHVEILYSELCRKRVIASSTVDKMRRELATFLAEESEVPPAKGQASDLIANAIWGACQQCAVSESRQATGEVYQLVERVAALLKARQRGGRSTRGAAMMTRSTVVGGHC